MPRRNAVMLYVSRLVRVNTVCGWGVALVVMVLRWPLRLPSRWTTTAGMDDK
jgi:hypothetical protein